MKPSSITRGGASSSGNASLVNSWRDDLSASASFSLSCSGSGARQGAVSHPSPKDSHLLAHIKDLHRVAVATALGRYGETVASAGATLIDDDRIQDLWSALMERSHLGYAEIAEALVDVARLCLVHDCLPAELARRLNGTLANVLPLQGPKEVDVIGHVRWILVVGKLTLEKVIAVLPLAQAGGVPARQLREKQVWADQQAARLTALEMWCDLARGGVPFDQSDDAIAVLVTLSTLHAGADFGRLHAAFKDFTQLCEGLGPHDLLERAIAILEEAEETLERDGTVLFEYLEPQASTPALSMTEQVDALLARPPARPPSYWKYCCERRLASMHRWLEDTRRRLQSSRDQLKSDLGRPASFHRVVARTRQVLEVRRTVKGLSGCLSTRDRGAEAEHWLHQLRAALTDMRSSEKTDKALGGVARQWMARLVKEGCLPKSRHCSPEAMVRIWLALAQRSALLNEMVDALVSDELVRLESALAEVSGKLKSLTSETRPLQRLQLALLIRTWEAGLPPTARPYESARRGFWGTAAYSFFRDGLCTYLSRLVTDSAFSAMQDFASGNDSVPDEVFDWLAFLLGGGLTVYSLYRMYSIRQAPEIDHTQSKFATVLRWSSGVLLALQAVGGVGATVAHRVTSGGGVSETAYRLWSAGVRTSAVIDISRWLRQALQSPLTLKASSIPLLGPRIKTIELRRLDGRMMPPEHAIEFHSIRDGGYTGVTTLLSGSLGQVDLQTLAFGLSRIGLAGGEAADAAWPDIAKLIFASRHPGEYRVVVTDLSVKTWQETRTHFDLHAAARSAFGGWVGLWANFTAMMYELYAESHTDAMRVLAFVGGFVLGATTAPRSRVIDDYRNASKGYVVTSGLVPWLYGTVSSGIPSLKQRRVAHHQHKIAQRGQTLDAAGRAVHQTAEQFRRWVDDLAKLLASVPVDARPDFHTVLHQQWKEESNPLAHLIEPDEVMDLLLAWRKEAQRDPHKAVQRQAMDELLKTASFSPVIDPAGLSPAQAIL